MNTPLPRAGSGVRLSIQANSAHVPTTVVAVGPDTLAQLGWQAGDRVDWFSEDGGRIIAIRKERGGGYTLTQPAHARIMQVRRAATIPTWKGEPHPVVPVEILDAPPGTLRIRVPDSFLQEIEAGPDSLLKVAADAIHALASTPGLRLYANQLRTRLQSLPERAA